MLLLHSAHFGDLQESSSCFLDVSSRLAAVCNYQHVCAVIPVYSWMAPNYTTCEWCKACVIYAHASGVGACKSSHLALSTLESGSMHPLHAGVATPASGPYVYVSVDDLVCGSGPNLIVYYM